MDLSRNPLWDESRMIAETSQPRPSRPGIQRSESGPKAKKFPVRRSFPHKREAER